MSNRHRRPAGRSAGRSGQGRSIQDAASSGPEETVLRASDPGELLTVVPYLLGYQPQNSLVLVVLAQRRLEMCARLDLALADHPDVLRSRIRSIVETQQAEAVLLISFGESELSRRALALTTDELNQPRVVTVVEAIHADGQRWWSIGCSADCCPPDGTPYDQTSNRLAAEAVWAGLSLAPNREQIAASVAGPAADSARRLRSRSAAVVREVRRRPLAVRQQRMAGLVTQCLETLAEADSADVRSDADLATGSEDQPDQDDLLELAALAGDIAVRDVAWAMMSRDEAHDHVRLWQLVVAHTVSELACPVLCLLGVAAWIAGNGTLQVCCLERAERLDPGYTMVDLLSDINARAAPPSLWDEIAPALRAELGPRAGPLVAR